MDAQATSLTVGVETVQGIQILLNASSLYGSIKPSETVWYVLSQASLHLLIWRRLLTRLSSTVFCVKPSVQTLRYDSGECNFTLSLSLKYSAVYP